MSVTWNPAVVVLESVDLLLLYLVYADGGKGSCLISYCSQVVFNVGLSYGLCRGVCGLPAMGMSGISLGTACAYLVGIAVLMPRLLDRSACGIRFVPKFRPRDLVRSCRISFGDAKVAVTTKQVIYFFHHITISQLLIPSHVEDICQLTEQFHTGKPRVILRHILLISL